MMNFISLSSRQDDTGVEMQKIEDILPSLGIELREEHGLSKREITQIHAIANRHTCLQSNDQKCYQSDAENGILKLYRESELLGYIFAHRGEIDRKEFFERGSLWVSKSLAGNNLGKYLMMKMTENLAGKNILSVTSNSIVQSVNELLMDYEVIHPIGTLKTMIEVRGEMKPDYRYFVNERLMGLL